MSRSLTFFQASVSGRNVIEKFLKSDLKRLRSVEDQLLDQLKVLRNTPVATLRETQRIEYIEPDLFSFRFSSKDHWVRLLITFWPTDEDIVVLLPLIKKRNDLDRADIDQANKNGRTLRSRG